MVFWGSLYTGGHSYGNKYRIFYQASDGTLNFQRSINTDGGGYGAWAQHLTLLPTQAVTISHTLTLSSGVVSIPGGTSTGPTYTFTGDTDTGLSAQTANTLIASAGGVTVGTFTTSGLTVMGGASYGGGSAHTTVTGISTADATATVLWTSAAVGVGDSSTVSARCVMVDVDSGAGDVGSDWIVGTFDKGAAGTLAVTSSLTTLHTKKKAGIATDHYSCTIRACTGVGAPDALCTVADTAQITCLNSGHSVHGAANMKCYVESTVLNDGV